MGLLVIIIAFAVILSPFPLPIPSPTTLRPTSPVSSFPVEDHYLGLSPSIIMGARRRNLRLARSSAESVCLRADRYLHHVEDHWGGTPPMERGGKTYDWRATAPTLFVFVLIATCTMARQDLTPCLAPLQHPCMQPHFTPTSSPPTLLHLVAISILPVGKTTVL